MLDRVSSRRIDIVRRPLQLDSKPTQYQERCSIRRVNPPTCIHHSDLLDDIEEASHSIRLQLLSTLCQCHRRYGERTIRRRRGKDCAECLGWRWGEVLTGPASWRRLSTDSLLSVSSCAAYHQGLHPVGNPRYWNPTNPRASCPIDNDPPFHIWATP